MKGDTIEANGFMRSLLCGLAVVFAAGASRAVDGVWLKTVAGNWDEASNWAGGSVASGAGSTATFTNAAGVFVNQNVPGLTLGGLLFANGNYTVTNGAVTLDNGGYPAAVTVGAGDVNTTRAVLAITLNGTGGLTKRGPGRLELTAAVPGTLGGPLSADAGTISSSATSGAPLGTGSVSLNGGTLDVLPAGSGQAVSLTAASGAVTDTFTYGKFSSLGLSKGANSSVTLTLGNAGAAAESVLARTNNGVLVIAPTNGTSAANLGAAERLLVNGGVATQNGMVGASVVGRNTGSCETADFLTYGANGFGVAAYTAGLGGGATSIASVTNNTATDTAQVYALRVHDGKTLTINSGQTLTVGDGVRPAGVLLNSSASMRAVITNGVLNFGASEGVVCFNNAVDPAVYGRMYSKLAGQGGVTFAGLSSGAGMALESNGGNLYTGDTRILSGRVRVAAANLLSGGDITVHGNGGTGGQLVLAGAMTLTNRLYLSGLTGFDEAMKFGALRMETAGTVLSGPIHLTGDTRISVVSFGGASTEATISGNISGDARFEAGGTSYTFGTLALTGTNTYTGGTRVNAGALKLGTGGTLGTGPVENNATLLFACANDLDFTNTLSGTGALVHQGAGTLKLSGASTYAGPLTADGTLDLAGRSLSFGALGGIGRVVNPSGPAAVLTVGSANVNTVFSGQMEDDIALVKTGTGTMTLFGTNSYSGATTVAGGTLKLGNGLSDIVGLAYRLDASDAAKVTRVDSNVTEWADSNGGAVKFTQATAALQPVYVTDSINGLPAIRFGDSASRRLVANLSAVAQTVFIVNRMTAFTGGNGIWGYNQQDFGIRAKSLTQWQHTSNGGNSSEFTWQGQMYINGVPGTTFTAYQPHILTAVSSNAVNWIAALGHYYTAQTTRYFRGEIGEVLVYNRVLSSTERQTVENYLSKKWLGGSIVPAVTNMLPAATSLSISNSASIDLNGVSQTAGSLSGAGTVRNSGSGLCTLTVGGDNASTAFSGVIEAAVSLVKTGSGTLTLYGANSPSGTTVVAGGTLKLGEWPLEAGLSYRLDATDAASLTLSGTNVNEWADADGGAVKFTQTTAALQPVYVTNAINGRPAVRFGDPVRNRMTANMKTNAQTTFIVYRMNAYGGTDGIWGKEMEDYGIRATSISSWQRGANTSDFTYQGQMYIDGVAGNTFSAYQPHVLTAVSSNMVAWTTAIGNYWGVSAGLSRYYRGDIGELLVYDRALKPEERQSVETYLALKWFGSGISNRLSTNVTVAAGATLDLNGQVQTLSGLTGGGAVINGSVTVNGLVAPGGDGTVGTLSLSGTPDLAGKLLIDVRLDGTCDVLSVSGDLDVSQLELVIANAGLLGNSNYTIATCAGALSGIFTGDNLPEKMWSVRYDRTPGAGRIMLVPLRGTMISVR